MNIGHLYDIRPAVHFAARASAGTGNVWGPRRIPDCQLFYVIAGEATLQLGPEHYRVKPGECVFYGPDSPHILKTDAPTQYYSLHFGWNESTPVPLHPAYGIRSVPDSDLERLPEPVQLTVDSHGEMAVPHHFAIGGVEPVMSSIVSEYQAQHAQPLLLRARMMELLSSIVGQLVNREATKNVSKIESALRAMRDHPGKAWSVAELAQLCGYHPSYFTKLFHQEVKTNPKQYLIAERIRQAKQSLLRGEKLDEIADRLGYTSIHYFSSNFKKETGLSPSEFRQQGKLAGGKPETQPD
ncbi:AraC family transcriptional regulator [Paenibacillus allorhizosphaerae]|uniref:HTH-type transcriptional activator RhaR n=1 Tax=Paenibacillus allorhizosphaerae TaxID=2849866 RepID=A0ABN7TQ78_9BACL|nr:AraC family transcriptional regulator [Paenibacillus allorhizosphaerae]CAG7646269.1 HTH-type transcriptional activator RhaR [Paenibacillus allorhizosphaerae]